MRRASFCCYQKFSVNKMELWLLCALNAYLNFKGVTIVSKLDFFRQVTANPREKAKMQGYYQGLVTKGCVGVYEYIQQPGSESVGISELGAKVLSTYDESLQFYADKFKRHPHRLDASIIITADPQDRWRRTA